MTTSVQVDRGSGFVDIDYTDFSIEVGTSAVQVAPAARVTTQAREDISANLDARIQQDGTTIFEGVTASSGTTRQNGQVKLTLDHPASALYAEKVDVTETGPPTDLDVLNAALSNANRGGNFTLDYAGTATTLDSDYEVTNRSVTSVFRDMMDRVGRVWWIDPATTTIHVEPPGFRGQWKALDAETDGVIVRSFDEGSVGSVKNDVTVTATGGKAVSATATDSTSISTYGRRSSDINIAYATTQAEAQAVADALLIPDPLASGEILVPKSVGTLTEPLVNYDVDLTDASKDIDETDLVIEKQTIEQGRATLKVGQGSAVSIANVNRETKSSDDKTAAGTVYGKDRLADDSVDTNQLVDAAVIKAKLQDAAVATAKLENNAVINGKLDDLSVSETKIQDDSIATPKLQAEAVTANEIEADTITASQIAAGTITALEIVADTITADEIAAATITALEIDTLDLDTTQLNIGTTAGVSEIKFTTSSIDGNESIVVEPAGLAYFGRNTRIQEIGTKTVRPNTDNLGSVGLSSEAYSEMHAYAFIDADTGSEISDGGDPLAGLADGTGPPEHTRVRDDGDSESADNSEGEWVGTDISALASDLIDICRAQQRHIEDQQAQIDDLVARVEALESDDGGNA